MDRSIKIFKIFGIDVKLHISWWFVFVLIAWSLSEAFFPQFFPEQTTVMYWLMGLSASLLLFVSVLLHELSHSLIAKAKGIKVESITLFFFGGVAGITKEDMKPMSEFFMALAGPAFSLLLAGFFYFIYLLNVNLFLTAISFYLYQLNLILALFNLVPGFPLDGGRALRAILYAYYKDLRKATYIAVKGGKFFAILLMVLGVYGIFSGIGTGLWFIFLGGFLYFIAGMSYEQVVIREVLSKIKVKELVDKKFIKVSPKMKFSVFIKSYINSDKEIFLVKDKTFEGLVDLKKVEKMSNKMQQMVVIKQISVPLSRIKKLSLNDNAYLAFRLFTEQNLDVLPVMNKNKIIGLVRRKNLMHRLVWSLKFSGFSKKNK
jgi:Zn-dependent protease